MAKNKGRQTGTWRPLGPWARRQLRSAYKHLRSPFPGVRRAALQEVHRILNGGRGASRSAGRHVRNGASSLLPAWLRKLWGHKGWGHRDLSPAALKREAGRGTSQGTPIMAAERAGRGRGQARPLTHVSTPAHQAPEREQAPDRHVNVVEGRHEFPGKTAYHYDTPHGPVTADRPLTKADMKRTTREMGEHKKAVADGKMAPDAPYQARYINGVKVKDVVPPVPAPAKAPLTERGLKERARTARNGQEPAKTRTAGENGSRPHAQDPAPAPEKARENGQQSHGRHAAPAEVNGHERTADNDREQAPPAPSREREHVPPLPADQVREAPARGRSR